MSLVSLAVPAVTAVIADARKPDGVTRRLYSAVKVRLTGPSKDRELSGSQVELDKEKEV